MQKHAILLTKREGACCGGDIVSFSDLRTYPFMLDLASEVEITCQLYNVNWHIYNMHVNDKCIFDICTE